ncbi:hypothetical protein OS965_30005 [Streptomyces sp. H27-G5]|uniref:hypothetical protein n=1 Tax=Streptomyces sp. H27-G5 TaxID=2996698 RepID=UPI00226E105E|nr:hypothetical protein [Streptomyces sp. H27-G5]MCY0922345.1 hypothetical protein [Streptomyces sp. H27-G5]
MASISIILLLLAACAAFIKMGSMKVWHVLLAAVLGFYIRDSAIGPQIGDWLAAFFNWLGTLKV